MFAVAHCIAPLLIAYCLSLIAYSLAVFRAPQDKLA